MIQRIQTLWLALAVVLTIAAFSFPLAVFSIPAPEFSDPVIYKFIPSNKAIYKTDVALWAMLLNCLTGIIALVTVFLYKNRSIQMKVLAFAFLSAVIELAVIFAFQTDLGLKQIVSTILQGKPELIAPTIEKAKISYGLATYFPAIECICFFFAMQGIKKDERLVKSADRLR